MTLFLWVMIGLTCTDLICRFIAFGTQELPKRTWGAYAVDTAVNIMLLFWMAYLLVTR